jgi:hypothetical protein
MNGFRMGVDDALRRRHPDPAEAPQGSAPGEALPAAVDQVFGDWLPAAGSEIAAAAGSAARTGLGELRTVASALAAAWHPFGGKSLPLADLPWQDIGDALLQGGTAILGALEDAIHAYEGGALPSAAPTDPDTAEFAPRLPQRREGADASGLRLCPVFLETASKRTAKSATLWLAALAASGCSRGPRAEKPTTGKRKPVLRRRPAPDAR